MSDESSEKPAKNWLEEWWDERIDAERAAHNETNEERGYLALTGLASGGPTIHPWSAVAGAREKLQRRIDLPTLRYSVYKALGVA